MSNDFTSTLVLNLQQRVAYMENALGFLTSEVQRLSQTNSPSTQGFQTAIPLQPARRVYAPRTSQTQTQPARTSQTQASQASHASQEDAPPPMALSEILTNGEEVVFGIHTGRDGSGGVTTSFLTSTFDGTNLTVIQCSTVASLVGLSTAKPGEILFKFMHGLVDAGHLPRSFNALPWRLATVTRNGQKITLAQLRRDKQDAQ